MVALLPLLLACAHVPAPPPGADPAAGCAFAVSSGAAFTAGGARPPEANLPVVEACAQHADVMAIACGRESCSVAFWPRPGGWMALPPCLWEHGAIGVTTQLVPEDGQTNASALRLACATVPRRRVVDAASAATTT